MYIYLVVNMCLFRKHLYNKVYISYNQYKHTLTCAYIQIKKNISRLNHPEIFRITFYILTVCGHIYEYKSNYK